MFLRKIRIDNGRNIFAFFEKEKNLQKHNFAVFCKKKTGKIFLHFFSTNKLEKIIFAFFILFFLKNKKMDFSQNCMTMLMQFQHFFAEFHPVCYMQLTELHVANWVKFCKKMLKLHQHCHAVLGKIHFFYFFKKNKKNAKIIFPFYFF